MLSFELLKLLSLLILSLINKANKILSARGACGVLQSVAAETLKELFMKLSKVSIPDDDQSAPCRHPSLTVAAHADSVA